MSRYRPAISIRTDLSNPSAVTGASIGDPVYNTIASKVEEYSITPRTLKSVTEFDPAYVVTLTGAVSTSGVSAYNPELYTTIEEYSYAGNIVLRYGIRSDLMTPDSSGAILGEGRSGIKGSSVSTSVYNSSMARGAILHSIEKYIMKEAIKSFVSGATNTVVVDIFERSSGVPVNIDTTMHPITHSVVLHFVSGEVCVIDPSNFSFSSHLANDNFELELQTSGLPIIKTIHSSKFKIYTPIPSTKVGPDFSDSRDCTDIAVKIAFALNKNPIAAFDEKSLKSYPGIVAISNDDIIDKSIIDKKIPTRIKQNSSLLCQEAFIKSERDINEKMKKILDKLEMNTQIATAEREYTRILTTQASVADMLNALEVLDTYLNNEIGAHLHAEHTILTGCIASFLAETP